MGRTDAHTYEQPDINTCGPAALKSALEILDKHRSLDSLVKLCKTNSIYGTSTTQLIQAINKLGISVLAVEYSTLRHLQSALKYKPNQSRAVIVQYLYKLKKNYDPHEDSGHYATVASYSARNSRIILFDSNSGKKKSYLWTDFHKRWYDYNMKRVNLKRGNRKFKLIRKWVNKLMLVLALEPNHLPKFTIPTAKLFLPKVIKQNKH